MRNETKIFFEIQEFAAVRFIGRAVTVGKKNPVPKLWQDMQSDGTMEYLQNMPERVSPKGDTIGWMGEYNSSTKEFTYIAGIFTKPDTVVPEGFSFRDIPDCLMGIGLIQGASSNLEKGMHAKTERIMKENGYSPDYSVGISMEYYSYEKFLKPEQEGVKAFTFGYYLPCKKA